MKSIFYYLLPLGLMLAFASCDQDDCDLTCQPGQVLTADCTCVNLNENPCADVTCDAGFVCVNGDCVEVGDTSTELVTENVTSDQTWTKDKIWILTRRIAVESGATLTIEAGTVIKGEAGSGANASALVIARGARLMAMGTSSEPIIFTSVADEIQPGQIASPNLEPNFTGLWGGLIILGRAPASLPGDVTEFQIEGIPPSDVNGRYGGNDPADNSGVIQYISIRHGGSNIGEGNEINGLTLGSVGSGTVIDHVEVVANDDDGIEWFGGTVNVTHAVVWNSADDAIDTDQAWAGTLDNAVVLCGSATDHALEIDGPEGSLRDGHTIRNVTVRGNEASELADFRDGAEGTFENMYFFDFGSPALTEGRGDFSLSGDATQANFANGTLVFNNIECTVPSDVTDITTVMRHGTDAATTQVARLANTVGADLSAFTGWSWSHAAGQLNF